MRCACARYLESMHMTQSGDGHAHYRKNSEVSSLYGTERIVTTLFLLISRTCWVYCRDAWPGRDLVVVAVEMVVAAAGAALAGVLGPLEVDSAAYHCLATTV